jgi:membrane-bound lytic murein transglycosylase MltF
MSSGLDPSWRVSVILLVFCVALVLIGCGKQETSPAATASQPHHQAGVSTRALPSTTGSGSNALSLPLDFDRYTGDLDEMVKRRNIRVLVIPNPIGFFYDNGRPRGALYESLEEFQKFTNKKLNTGTLSVKVTYLPMAPAQVEAALTEGMGDLVANAVVITPERATKFAFSTPIQTNVTQIVVSGPAFGTFSSLEELNGKEIFINPLTVAYEDVQKVNAALTQAGKTPIQIKAVDKNLTPDDLVQMVNAGLIPATVTTSDRAELWSKVLGNLKSHPDVVLASAGQTAWVMRKNNPQLKQLADEFISTHGLGTSFGNTLLRRYLKNGQWVKNATSKKEMDKFLSTVQIFQRYATQYDFDYLMLTAQGYQESMLNQQQKSPRGAVGIMQVLPKYAAASPINIPDVAQTDANIHAGVKMLRNIVDTYFNDPKLDPVDRTLFAFASYNAGPTRIAGLRRKAKERGLNPDIWFENVELVVAQDIGQETVTYVGNIYKYYVAYKLALEQQGIRQKATATASAAQ